MPHSEVASWYGFGHCAANGGRFAPDSLIAVHRSLPIGTRVRWTYGGRSVVVRINDRGPFIAGRVIDLSRWAARAIGLSGVGRVHLAIRGRNGAQHGSLSDQAPGPEVREGERLTAYKDSVDVWTIGTGIANASDLIVGKPGLTITKAQWTLSPRRPSRSTSPRSGRRWPSRCLSRPSTPAARCTSTSGRSAWRNRM